MAVACKYCGTKTDRTKSQICYQCNDKLKLIRDIKGMITPVYEQKKEREDRILGEYKNLHKY